MPRPADPMSPDAVLAEVGVRTVALVAEVARSSDAGLRAPSALPGWTVGHVVSHVGNQAEALAGVLRAAARGEVGSMYPSRPARDAAIEAGAGRSVDAAVRHLLDGAERLSAAWHDLPPDRLGAEFTAPAGWFRPVRDAPWFRWRELALHHVDLGSGTPATARALDSSDPLVARLLDETVAGFAGRDDVPPLLLTAADSGRRSATGAGAGTPVRIEGTTAALVAWLTGRTDGAGLTASATLPTLPAWL